MKDLRGLRPSQLASDLGISPAEAYDIICVVQGNGDGPVRQAEPEQAVEAPRAPAQPHCPAPAPHIRGRSAHELYAQSNNKRPVITFCKAIDKMMGGGIWPGELVEICGVPGIGKTQFGMQLAVNVQIPKLFAGVEGETIFIDTEGSFMVERALQISEGVFRHLKKIAVQPERQARVQSLSGDAFLKGIHVMRVHDLTEQLAAVNHLPSLLQAHPGVKLIVLDSVAFHFRHGSGTGDFAKRSRLLSAMAQKLNDLANRRQVAVVLMNQMTTKMASGGEGAKLVPALGESWAHVATHRIQLFWNSAHASGASAGKSSVGRFAKVVKSSSRAPAVVPYVISSLGVRDVGRQYAPEGAQATKKQRAGVAS